VGLPLHHVKPHGALYMMALEDEAVARAVAEATLAAEEGVQLYTIKGSAMDDAASRLGLQVVAEFFADRGYHPDGAVKMFDWTLEEAGGSAEAIGQRVVRMLLRGTVATLGGGEARVVAETVCVHSDTPGSPAIARAIRQALAAAGIPVSQCPGAHLT